MTRLAIELNQNTNDLTVAAISAATSGAANTLVAATAGAIIRVYKLLLVPITAVTVQFLDGTNVLTGIMSLAATAQLILPFDTKPWFTTSAGNAFNMTLGGGVQCSGMIYYTVGGGVGGAQ
jgi:hypothetical protein